MKNLLCREQYYSLLTERPTNCKIINCRGAHSEEEIILYNHIKTFNEMDKSLIDLYKLYNIIKNKIIEEKFKIKLEEHKNKIDNIDKYNFVELLQLWRELACYYRKISKTDPSIPQLYLDENEDIVWSLERITKMCNTFIKQNRITKDKLLTSDLCLGSHNCKEGVHNYNELLCIDDILYGKCNCMSKKELDGLEIEQHNLYRLLSEELLNEKLYDRKYKKYLELVDIELRIKELRNSRLLHLTEFGLLCFNKSKLKIDINIDIRNDKIEKSPIIKLKLGRK